MGQIKIITCPKCGAEFRWEKPGHAFFRYGSPFRKCSKCGQEYYDDCYHEMALEQEPHHSVDEKKQDKKWYRALHHAEIKDAEEYRLSCERLRDRNYLGRLCAGLSDDDIQRMREKIDRQIGENLSEYFDWLAEKIGPPSAEFRLKFSDELFSQLSYEARKPAAVEYVVRRILSHYGVNGNNITVQTEYRQKDHMDEKGTLGSFTSIGRDGGIIKIVLVQAYSTYDSIIAVALHECAHALLHARGATLADTERNEILTDTTAIYMGGGAYFQRGCYAFSSFRIGYLYKIECEWIRREVGFRRGSIEAAEKQALREIGGKRRDLIRDLERRLERLNAKMKDIRPSRVIREKGIALKAFSEFAQWNEQGEDIAIRIMRLEGRDGSADEMKKDIRWLAETERRISLWEKLADEWARAEEHQTGLPSEKAENLRGMIPLAEGGNAFARLAFVRFWASCDATKEDARAYIRGFMDREDPDSLCAAGICLMEGLDGEKDEVRGRGFLCRAAAFGSRDAARILGA